MCVGLSVCLWLADASGPHGKHYERGLRPPYFGLCVWAPPRWAVLHSTWRAGRGGGEAREEKECRAGQGEREKGIDVDR